MIIYKATNQINDKSYIGQTTKKLSKRIYNHQKSKRNLPFYNAISKYGIKNFTWEVLEKCDNQKQLNEMEFHYIKQYNTLSPNGYNLTQGFGNTTTGYKFTKQQLEKRSKMMIGKNNPNYGNGDKISGDKNPAKRPEVREKIRQSKLGKKRPDFAKICAKHFIITDLSTGEKEKIFNMAEWLRNHTNFNYTGVKNVLNGKWKQYHGFHFTRCSLLPEPPLPLVCSHPFYSLSNSFGNP